jgi:acyl-CoA synthetase (AMP-forming)/AMP-acid ligase II
VSQTILDLLAGKDDAPAIAAPGRPSLSHAALRRQVRETARELNALGIRRADRVGMVLANGPEMAVAFLAVTAAGVAAPFNPAYRADEFDFYLGDLGCRALLVEAGATSPATEVARKRSIPVIELVPRPESEAGLFSLRGRSGGTVAQSAPAPGDTALLLHTSGTTSRPKIVPLSHANLAASARNIVSTLSLAPEDRGLHVMPLFHIHGIVAGLLAPLLAGGSVFVTPGFNALKFFAWLDEARPTWYTAVPTMHQTILARADRNAESIARSRLRFIRSSSASLPPSVMAKLEETFHAPVVEAYAMTEAAHQMTSNPLPPGARKPGSVGLPAGPEVAILDESGGVLGAGRTGEISIRGENVMGGYENNPQANAAAFTHGWFRTGDQGVLDEEGYLRITGRLKEIINRGGEKISPREVDEVLLAHPAVAQALTFAVPHDKLGEDVAAALVLREGQRADEQEIRSFAAQRLADFKVPRKVVFLAQIPVGPTGKLQRIGLARKLGLA